MPIFIRKINRAKWPELPIKENAIPSADAITGCLRTSKNTLSLWEIDNDTELMEAVLAIVSQSEKADTIDVIMIDPDAIKSIDIHYAQTDGVTAYGKYADRHFDLIDLDYNSLGCFASIVIKALVENKSKRILRKEIKDLLLKGIEERKIDPDTLKEKMRDDLGLKKETSAKTF